MTKTSFGQQLKYYLRKTILLYSAGDTSPYNTWKYGYYSHKLVQVRWYLIEIPLMMLGLAVALKRGQYRPELLFVILYTMVVVLMMHIEIRYALLPILYLKMFTALGVWTLIESARRWKTSSRPAGSR